MYSQYRGNDYSSFAAQKHHALRYLVVKMEPRWRAEACWTEVFGSEDGAQMEGRSMLNWGIWQWGRSPDGGQKHPELRYSAVRTEPWERAEASWTVVFVSEDGAQTEARRILNWGIRQWGWSLAVRAEASWIVVFVNEDGAQMEGRRILNWGIWQWGRSADGGQKHPELRYLAGRMEPRWRAEASWIEVSSSEDRAQQWGQKHPELRYSNVRMEPSSEGTSILNWGNWQWGWSQAVRTEASWTEVFGSEDGAQQWGQKHPELRYLSARMEPRLEGRSILVWGIWQWGWSPAVRTEASWTEVYCSEDGAQM